MYRLITYFLLAVTPSWLMAGETPIITVGPELDLDCDTDSIQMAIDQGIAAEIRLAHTSNHIFREHLSFHDNNEKVIKGGYESCADAVNDIVGNVKTTLSGDLDDDGVGDGTVVTISGVGNVDFHNVTITEGDGGFFAGGILAGEFVGNINLHNTWVYNNTGVFGGGVAVAGAGVAVNLYNEVYISSNSSLFSGGGVYCTGDNQINFTESASNTGVFNNEAVDDGGGLYLIEGCSMEMHTGRFQFLEGDFRGITLNKAGRHGGGMYLASGASALLTASGDQVVNISSNQADQDDDQEGNGGGIYATGIGTTVLGQNIYVENNFGVLGGGIYLNDFAVASVTRSEETCWNEGQCNLFEWNLGFFGGAVAAENGAGVLLSNALVQNNRALGGSGLLLNLSAIGNMTGNVFTNNGSNGANNITDSSLVLVFDGSSYTSYHDTMADNNLVNSVIETSNNQLAAVDINLTGSIIHDPSSGLVLGTLPDNANLEFNCLMVHEKGSFNGQGIRVFEDDPEFIDRNNRNFHLNAEISPAVDMCESNEFSIDIDGEIRNFDSPYFVGIPNYFADAGADESLAGDLIFEDDFEEL